MVYLENKKTNFIRPRRFCRRHNKGNPSCHLDQPSVNERSLPAACHRKTNLGHPDVGGWTACREGVHNADHVGFFRQWQTICFGIRLNVCNCGHNVRRSSIEHGGEHFPRVKMNEIRYMLHGQNGNANVIFISDFRGSGGFKVKRFKGA